jgi:protease I
MANLSPDIYRPESANAKSPRAILMITADGTEDLEFFYPYYRFIEAGFRVDVVTPGGGAFKGKQGLGLKQTLKISEVVAENYEMLYIPGGKAPTALKEDDDAIELTRQFVTQDKPIAAVCHGPQLLAAADIIEGLKIAAWPEVEEEVREAGASYINQETVVDGRFITARWPGDLPAHMKATLEILNKGRGTAGIKQVAA